MALEFDADCDLEFACVLGLGCDAEFGAPAVCELDFAPPPADADVELDAGVEVEAEAAVCDPLAVLGAAAGAALATAAAALLAASISASVSIASGKSIAAGFGAISISLENAPKPNCEASMR